MRAPSGSPGSSRARVETASLAAQDAAEALIALGWPVVPFGPDMDEWRIGDLVWTDDELMALAIRHGIQPVAGLIQ